MDSPINLSLRREEPPADGALVVRGGINTLSSDHVCRQAAISLRQYGFWAISAFLARDGDVASVVDAIAVLQERPKLRLARCGDVRAAGFALLPTGAALHYSVVLADLTETTLERLRGCFGVPVPNPGFRATGG